MAKYSLEIYELLNDGVDIFDFEYDFYIDDDEVKKRWEQKFIDYFMFYEIGFSTVYKFKHYLREKLNRIAPYYRQLYQTEVRCRDIDFMLNKDLKETFLREIDNKKDNDISKQTVQNNNVTTDYESLSNRTNTETKEEDVENTTNRNTTDNGENTTNISVETTNSTNSSIETTNSTNTSVETTNGTTVDDKQSSIPNGNASIDLADGYLTYVAKNETNEEGTETNTTSVEGTETNTTKVEGTETNEISGTSKNTIAEEVTSTNHNEANTSLTEGIEQTTSENTVGKADEDTKINETETSNMIEATELISKGNIGTTSSAELLEKWRRVLINIDELLIFECRELFMMIM